MNIDWQYAAKIRKDVEEKQRPFFIAEALAFLENVKSNDSEIVLPELDKSIETLRNLIDKESKDIEDYKLAKSCFDKALLALKPADKTGQIAFSRALPAVERVLPFDKVRVGNQAYQYYSQSDGRQGSIEVIGEIYWKGQVGSLFASKNPKHAWFKSLVTKSWLATIEHKFDIRNIKQAQILIVKTDDGAKPFLYDKKGNIASDIKSGTAFVEI